MLAINNEVHLRDLPSVDRVLKAAPLAEWAGRAHPNALATAARAIVDEQRRLLLEGDYKKTASIDPDELAQLAAQRLAKIQRPTLPRVINATGIAIHTGLGRSPLAPAAVAAVAEASGSYTPVEIDIETGRRGSRTSLIEPMLCQLTGAEAGCVVNNNAASLVLSLAALAKDREVIVSRGELIEIGGGFRLPDIMAASGAKLVEVGTTNRTRLADFKAAITPSTAALLKVHPSNYRVSGFAEQPDVNELVRLANQHNLPLLHDTGSGALGGASHQPVPRGEPDAHASITSGADAVMFSGDKLLGGPQAGLIVGNRKTIDLLKRHPLMRAFRVDKMTLAALGATLQIYLDPSRANELPIGRMLSVDANELRRRAESVAAKLQPIADAVDVSIVESESFAGGGSAPEQALPGWAVQMTSAEGNESVLATRLRTANPGVFARISQGALLIEMRTVASEDDDRLADALIGAMRSGILASSENC